MQIDVNGETLLLDPAGAAFWPQERTLIFADLHFEKGSSLARRGALLPPYDTRTTLKRMAAAIARHAPTRIVALGDSFHDPDAADRLEDEDRQTLAALGRAADWIWITGNHDPAPPTWLGGFITSEIAFGGLVFRHEPGVLSQRGEIAGHLHPCTTVNRRGRSLRRRCFVSDGERMVMPAFGAYAGGLDLWEDAFQTLFRGAFAAYVLGTARVYAVAGRGIPQTFRRKASEESQPRNTAARTVVKP
jgi:DNA ligase-associated metallophosphoesterase